VPAVSVSPRRDCSAASGDWAGGDHHAARRGAQEEKDVARERVLEAASRLDRRADDDELGAALCDDARDVLAEEARPRADDLASHADAVRRRDGRRRVEPLLQLRELETRVERQLAVDIERHNEHNPRAAVGGEAAGKVERMLRLLPLEQRHDDRPVRDRARAAREPPRAKLQDAEVGPSHLTSG
jgi:hypothetical protein